MDTARMNLKVKEKPQFEDTATLHAIGYTQKCHPLGSNHDMDL